MRTFFRHLFRAAPVAVRDHGRPTSRNGASSFHLQWQTRGRDLVAASVVLTIVAPPQTDDLYFFALQASFFDGSVHTGGGHLGLQWNHRHPGSTAVNWGGYASQPRGGHILDGTESPLPSVRNDPNTRDFTWHPGSRYRLAISPTPDRPGWWRGTVADLAAGSTHVILDLDGGGSRLGHIVVWSEVFAPCDAPSVTVRWEEPDVTDAMGATTPVTNATVNYQPYERGGCTNTTSVAEGPAFLQTTAVPRATRQGASLHVPRIA